MPLKLVRRAKSPYWIIRGTVGGIRIEESTGTNKRWAAEQIRVKREAELLEEAIHGKRATYTFAHAVTDYLENGGSRRFLQKPLEFFGTAKLAHIGQHEIDQASRLIYPNASPSTVNRQLFTPVSAVLHSAAQKGWCDTPRIKRPRQTKPRIRWLRISEAESLINACDPFFAPLVEFLFFTGARVGEALALDWQEVDLEMRQVRFIVTKNDEPRGVPLHPRLISRLSRSLTRTGKVFRRADGSPYLLPQAGQLNDTSCGARIRHPFAKACKKAGITDFHPHDCRHTFATWHYQKNHDLSALMSLGGWKSISMVMRYAHTNIEQHSKTIDALDGGKWGDAPPISQKE